MPQLLFIFSPVSLSAPFVFLSVLRCPSAPARRRYFLPVICQMRLIAVLFCKWSECRVYAGMILPRLAFVINGCAGRPALGINNVKLLGDKLPMLKLTKSGSFNMHAAYKKSLMAPLTFLISRALACQTSIFHGLTWPSSELMDFHFLWMCEY
jgi:hypothetical protein